jgi:hypothetical protein
VGRICPVYVPGLRVWLQKNDPAMWAALEALEGRLDALATEGRHEAALTACACWEAAWRRACETYTEAPVEVP